MEEGSNGILTVGDPDIDRVRERSVANSEVVVGGWGEVEETEFEGFVVAEEGGVSS